MQNLHFISDVMTDAFYSRNTLPDDERGRRGRQKRAARKDQKAKRRGHQINDLLKNGGASQGSGRKNLA